MDWGMMQSPEKIAQVVGSFGAFPAENVEKPADCTHVLLRPRLRFGLWISLVILVTDVGMDHVGQPMHVPFYIVLILICLSLVIVLVLLG
jgi:hypothetical protein